MTVFRDTRTGLKLIQNQHCHQELVCTRAGPAAPRTVPTGKSRSSSGHQPPHQALAPALRGARAPWHCSAACARPAASAITNPRHSSPRSSNSIATTIPTYCSQAWTDGLRSPSTVRHHLVEDLSDFGNGYARLAPASHVRKEEPRSIPFRRACLLSTPQY